MRYALFDVAYEEEVSILCRKALCALIGNGAVCFAVKQGRRVGDNDSILTSEVLDYIHARLLTYTYSIEFRKVATCLLRGVVGVGGTTETYGVGNPLSRVVET